MEKVHEFFKNQDGFIQRSFINGLLECWFYHLQIPGAEIVPDEFIHGHEGIGKFVAVVLLIKLPDGFLHPCIEPKY